MTYQGSIFTDQNMVEFASEVGIKLLTRTPYYAQENRQVEAANKIIIKLIKKHMGRKPNNWHKTPDQAIWACQASPKEVTNANPFRLIFGHGAVLSPKIYLHSTRIQRKNEIPSNNF